VRILRSSGGQSDPVSQAAFFDHDCAVAEAMCACGLQNSPSIKGKRQKIARDGSNCHPPVVLMFAMHTVARRYWYFFYRLHKPLALRGVCAS